jgi:leader peptidase (prepilin peptidase)/N-methyltransferase
MIIKLMAVMMAGFIAGIFVNYLADVLPLRRKISRPFCLHCKTSITLLDYILLRSCRKCNGRISLRHIVVVILGISLTAMLWLSTPTIGFWLSFAIAAYFGLVIVIDLEHRLVMHPVSLSGAVIGLGVGTWLHGILSSIIGSIAGFGIMLVLYFLGIGFVRLVARKRELPEDGEGIGFGDVILSGVMGTFLGWPGVVGGLVLTILLGGLTSLGVLLFLLMKKRYQAFSAIPYAPFIAVATVILLFLARH